MQTRLFLTPPLIVLVAVLCLLPVRSHAEWQRARGVTVWTRYPNKERNFTWTGGVDTNGRAEGRGVYTVYFGGSKVATYTGTMRSGHMNGQFSAIYHREGNRYEGEMLDGDENGFGTMSYPDGSQRTGRWVNAKLVEPGATPPVTGLASVVPATVATPAPAEPVTNGVVATAMRRADAPRGEASATEKFVRQLADITSRYFMEVAYRMAPSDDFSDAFWAGARARAVAELLNSPLGGEIPASLNKFCREALLLDGMLQIIYAKGDGEADRGRDEVLGMIRGMVEGLPGTLNHGSEESDSVEMQGLKVIFNTFVRVQQTEQMYRIFREAKAKADLHRRWASLLTGLATADPGLRAFAADPRTSDPSWHFLHRGLGGDAYFGASRDTTRTSDREIVNAASQYIGNLAEGPILVRFSSRSRNFGYVLKMRGTEYGAVYVGHCRRGQFGFVNSNGPSAWVTPSMTDDKNKGRLAFPGERPGRLTNLEMVIWHFATIGLTNDTETEGEVLFYLEHQFPSEAAAAKVARRVNL